MVWAVEEELNKDTVSYEHLRELLSMLLAKEENVLVSLKRDNLTDT